MSVELVEPLPQYPQSPSRLLEKPQSLGSFVVASMQLDSNEFAGRAQFVKSALICDDCPVLSMEGLGQRLGLATILASLSA